MPQTRSSIVIRPFRRSDREQLTELVNVHVGAVVPGWAVSINAVMAQLEREPGEPIVDPWVAERATLVALDPGWVQTDMGGGAAPLTVQDSVHGLRSVLASLGPDDNGRLIHHDGRRAESW